jgi:hypothetical protein
VAALADAADAAAIMALLVVEVVTRMGVCGKRNGDAHWLAAGAKGVVGVAGTASNTCSSRCKATTNTEGDEYTPKTGDENRNV